MRTPEDRFASRVKKSEGCWEWLGYKRNGYGQFWMNGKHYQAHRAAYEFATGSIPSGMCVCHTCDNPSCVNPDHLFIGTHQDNMADRDSKGRLNIQKGSDNSNAKLTDVDTHNIRSILQHIKRRGISAELAEIYGVNRSAISRVKLNRTYKVTDPRAGMAILPDDAVMWSVGVGGRP